MEPAPEDNHDIKNLLSNLEVDTPQAQCPDVIVIFAVSTTDTTRDSGIVQISARCNDNVFTKHILPVEDVHTNCGRFNGFAIQRVANERRLFYDEVEVETVSPRDGLKLFLKFLRDLLILCNSGKVVLAAHNTFHGYTMIRQIQRYGLLRTFESRVSGFIDTVDVLKSKLEERAQNHESFALDQLARAYLGENFVPEIRNAEKNVEILVSLINNRQCSDEEMMEFAKELTQFIDLMPERVEARIEGLRPISNAVSNAKWKEIAKAGISIDTLRQRYQEGAVDGVTMLLEGVINGTPRNRQRIINVITDKLHAMSEADNQNLQPA